MRYAIATIMIIGTFAAPAHAACNFEFQGIHSHWVCPPGESVGGNYHDLFQYLREQVTGECAQAVGNFYAKDFACIASIGAAAEAESVLAIGGAGSKCKELGPAFHQLAEACSDDLTLKKGEGLNPAHTLRACNNTGVPLQFAVGFDMPSGTFGMMGWHVIKSGSCRELVSSTGKQYLRAETLDGAINWIPGAGGNITHSACVAPGAFLIDEIDCSIGNRYSTQIGEMPPTSGEISKFTAVRARTLYFARENGIDYPNNDVRSLRVANLGECQDHCNIDTRCNLVAFNHATNTCHLKKRALNRRTLANIVTSHAFDKHPEIDYPNHDIRSFVGNGWGDCVLACTKDSQCRGAIHNPVTNRCWLKDALPSNNRFIAQNRDTYIRQ